jgi:hypothetical protein
LNQEIKESQEVTRKLVELHPLSLDEIRDIVLLVWDEISAITIRDLSLLKISNPQVLGTLIQRLMGAELAQRYPKKWRSEREKHDKDLVYIPHSAFSIEVKTSTHPREVFGNRSYTHGNGSKSRQGYFLTINYNEKGIRLIRFGWLLASEWKSQKSSSGQQARLLSSTYETSFIEVYKHV